MNPSSSGPDEQRNRKEADEAITAALNDLYSTEDSSLEPHIAALSLEALRSEEWRG